MNGYIAAFLILGTVTVSACIALIAILIIHGRNIQRWEQTKQRGKYYDWDLEKLLNRR